MTLIVPTVPGGAADAVARVLADRIGNRLGQRLVVENRPGGNGTIGTAAVARATPDGHTLLFGLDQSFVISPHLMQLPYDPVKSLAPVSPVGAIQFVLVAHPSLGVKTVREFIEAAKARPGAISYASGGDGSVHQMAMEQFRLAAGIRLHHVPYKAAPQGFADLVGGHIPVMFIALGPAEKLAKEGKVVALGVAGRQPVPSYPGVPTIGATLPGYSFESWFGIFTTGGSPAEAIRRLNAEFTTALSAPEVLERMRGIGLVPQTGPAEVLGALVRDDLARFAKVVQEAGLKKQ